MIGDPGARIYPGARISGLSSSYLFKTWDWEKRAVLEKGGKGSHIGRRLQLGQNFKMVMLD